MTIGAFSVMKAETDASEQLPPAQIPFFPHGVPSIKVASKSTQLPFPESHVNLQVDGVEGQALLIPSLFPTAAHCISLLVHSPLAHLPPSSSQVAPSGAYLMAGHSGFTPSHLESN